MAYETRVAAGAEWLDAHRIGWERLVDPATLDMNDCVACILGQVYMDQAGKGTSGFDYVRRDVFHCDPKNEMVNLGFDLTWYDTRMDDSAEHPPSFEELGQTWLALIKERFATGCLSDETAA